MRLDRRHTFTVPLVQTSSVRTLNLGDVNDTRRKSSVRVINPILRHRFRVITTINVRVFFSNLRDPMTVSIRRVTTVTLVRRDEVRASVMVEQYRIVEAEFTKVDFDP